MGGEQSGHKNYLDHNTTGDGMISALQDQAIMRRTGKTMSAMAKLMIPLHQDQLNVRVAERKEISEVPEVQKVIAAAEQKLGDTGRVLIRYSGTEPLLRIMLEGQDKYQITEMANEIGMAMEKGLGGHKEDL
jgi:phosphoglucosamine mutase